MGLHCQMVLQVRGILHCTSLTAVCWLPCRLTARVVLHSSFARCSSQMGC